MLRVVFKRKCSPFRDSSSPASGSRQGGESRDGTRPGMAPPVRYVDNTRPRSKPPFHGRVHVAARTIEPCTCFGDGLFETRCYGRPRSFSRSCPKSACRRRRAEQDDRAGITGERNHCDTFSYRGFRCVRVFPRTEHAILHTRVLIFFFFFTSRRAVIGRNFRRAVPVGSGDVVRLTTGRARANTTSDTGMSIVRFFLS